MTSEEIPKKTIFSKAKTTEEVLIGFQKLKNEQRFLVNKLSEFELDLQEHRVVLKTLRDMDGDRKCYRMVGGVLCERTVKDIIPLLRANEENLTKVIDTYKKRLEAKESELNKYKEEYSLRFKNLNDMVEQNEETKLPVKSSQVKTAATAGGNPKNVYLS